MGERVLTRRALNRALLARQDLLARAPATMSLPRMLERVGGIQAQYAPSMYVGLWSRLEGFSWPALERALMRRTVVQGTLLRGTIHLVSRADYWLWAAAIRESRRARWLRSVPGARAAAMEAGAAELRTALRDGPLWRKDVEALLGKEVTRGIHQWVDLVRAPPAGTWARRRADLWADASAWVGPPPAGAAPAAGLELLVRRYLGAFGPASRQAIASWIGVNVGVVTPVVEAMDLRRFESEDGTPLLDLPRAPLPDPATPAPARLIGHWDALLLTHCRAAGVLPEEHRPKVFHIRAPHSFSVLLVDGEVAGTWRLGEAGRVTLEPFGRLRAADRRELEAEGERLTAILPR